MFGRRKEGFAKEVIITEFSHEINEDRLNEEEERVLVEEDIVGEKMDLLEYLDELDEEESEEFEQSVIEEKSSEELLADFIRERSMGVLLTGRAFLNREDEDMEEIITAMENHENYKDITTIKGEKDIYYYSNQFMSENYARIAMLVEEKDLSRTIAEMVRWNAKTYPCPTPVYYFKNSPYYYTDEEINLTMKSIKDQREYEDIGEIVTVNNIKYFYSTLHMSERYAKALAESTEYGEYGYM